MTGRSWARRCWHIGGVPNEGTSHGRQNIHRLESAVSGAGRHPHRHGAPAAMVAPEAPRSLPAIECETAHWEAPTLPEPSHAAIEVTSPMPRPYARCLAHWWTADRTTIGNARPNGLWRDWYAAWIRRARRPGRDRVEARSLFMCRLTFCGGGGRKPCADWPRTVASRPGRCLRASRTIVSMDQDCARVRRSGPEWPDRWLR